MNNITELMNLNLGYIMFGLILIIVCAKFIWEGLDWLISKLGIKFQKDIIKEEEHKKLLDTVDRVNSIEQRDKIIEDQMTALMANVAAIQLQLKNMQDQTNKSKRAQLKDRIAQSYRCYHDVQQWTQMDKEAFEDLIRDYEAHGGQNSFVHSVCEPESFTWKMID